MPYSNEQKEFYNKKPPGGTTFSTVTFNNPIAGVKNILACGPNGPYKNMAFNDDGIMNIFQAVAATVPSVSTQDTSSNSLGTIRLARIASQVYEYMNLIVGGTTLLTDRVVTARIRVYRNPVSTPIYDVLLYIGKNGISISEMDVIIKLQFENPARIPYAPFYDAVAEYTGLQYG